MRPLIPLPAQEALVRAFDYSPETGLLSWKGKAARRYLPGRPAGTLHHSGYVQVAFEGRLYLAHRLIWKRQTGADPVEVDHKNKVRNDNRWDNLRDATASLNRVNRASPNIHRGVHWIADRRCFGAQIKINKKHTWLGCFDTPEEACAAYREAAQRLHGTFAQRGSCGCE